MRSLWMRTDEIAEEFRFTVRSGRKKGALDLESVRQFLRKHPHITILRRGRTVLANREDVLRAMTIEQAG